AKENEEEDRKVKERVEKLNLADGLIFNTEKQLKEFGDKISADKKAPIEAALEKLKEAHKSEDLDAIDKATEELNNVWSAASEEMYAGGAQQDAGAAGQASDDGGKSSQNGDDDVTDAEFEEVK
ncbi:MAG TPA: Hsp70 family protein, partial [Chitinophagaceae bacterium]|nr:Hsp70 family protein [Chitinophagaceae bacterium]